MYGDCRRHETIRPGESVTPILKRGVLSLFLLILFFCPGSTARKVAEQSRLIVQNEYCALDASHIEEGYLQAVWRGDTDQKVKLLITSPNGIVYQYDLCNPSIPRDLAADSLSDSWEAFPLSEGDGDYTAGVYRNLSGTSYSLILTQTFNIELADEYAPFLCSNQYVRFTEESAAVRKAAALCEDISEDAEKTERIYQFVIRHIAYDTEKAEQVQNGYLRGYLPDIDETLVSGKGICFDYAALTAAMLRSQGVPAKLVTGYAGKLMTGYAGGVFHAWVEVWSGTEWERLDPTFASAALGDADSVLWNYIGEGENYTPQYYY